MLYQEISRNQVRQNMREKNIIADILLDSNQADSTSKNVMQYEVPRLVLKPDSEGRR
jgi:hypothetical protein